MKYFKNGKEIYLKKGQKPSRDTQEVMSVPSTKTAPKGFFSLGERISTKTRNYYG